MTEAEERREDGGDEEDSGLAMGRGVRRGCVSECHCRCVRPLVARTEGTGRYTTVVPRSWSVAVTAIATISQRSWQ